MAHGDDLGMAVVQMSTTAAQSAMHTVSALIADIIKMIQASQEHRMRMQEHLKSGTDLSPLKYGEVKMKDLIDSARKNADTVSMSEHGISEADAKKLIGKAKEYGIPVAFTKNGDCVKAHVRGRDLPVFKQIFTDIMQDKITANPQSVGNFKVQKWEIPFLTAELSNYNLNAQFGRTKNGQHFCMFDKEDEKAILLARGSFLQKYKEVRDDFNVRKDEEGFYILNDRKSGKTITFDETQVSCREISDKLKTEFGYDGNKADIAAAKFGEEMLEGRFKQNYFDNPINDTKAVTTNIEFVDDDIYTKQYTCMRVVPKEDSIQRIAFADSDGRVAVLDPKMTHSQMADELKTQLGITDKKEIESLVNKAEKTMLYYSKHEEQKFSSEYKFSKDDFDMSDIQTVSGMRRETDGHVFTRTLPVDELKLDIDRQGKNGFTIKSSAVHLEKNENNDISRSTECRAMHFSFSDKKQAMHELEQFLIDSGVPQQVAGRIAYEAYGKAESQETTRIVAVEGIKTESAHYSADLKVEAEVYSNGRSGVVDVSDKDTGLTQLKETFGVSDEEAADMYDDIQNRLTDKQKNVLEGFGYNCDEWSVKEASFVIGKISDNGWNVPDDMNPTDFSIESIRNPISINTEKLSAPELPDVIDDADASIGGR